MVFRVHPYRWWRLGDDEMCGLTRSTLVVPVGPVFREEDWRRSPSGFHSDPECPRISRPVERLTLSYQQIMAALYGHQGKVCSSCGLPPPLEEADISEWLLWHTMELAVLLEVPDTLVRRGQLVREMYWLRNGLTFDGKHSPGDRGDPVLCAQAQDYLERARLALEEPLPPHEDSPPVYVWVHGSWYASGDTPPEQDPYDALWGYLGDRLGLRGNKQLGTLHVAPEGLVRAVQGGRVRLLGPALHPEARTTASILQQLIRDDPDLLEDQSRWEMLLAAVPGLAPRPVPGS